MWMRVATLKEKNRWFNIDDCMYSNIFIVGLLYIAHDAQILSLHTCDWSWPMADGPSVCSSFFIIFDVRDTAATTSTQRNTSKLALSRLTAHCYSDRSKRWRLVIFRLYGFSWNVAFKICALKILWGESFSFVCLYKMIDFIWHVPWRTWNSKIKAGENNLKVNC